MAEIAAAPDVGGAGSAASDALADDSVGYRDASSATGSKVRTGMAWTLGGQWVGYLVQIVTTAILARLIAPQQFGIVGEAATIAAFATQLQSLGLSQATVQRARLTHGQLSNLFWANVAAGAVLSVLVAASAPFVAAFYGHHALVGVTAVVAVGYLINGFAVQHAALLARRMRFRAIALRSLLPRILSGAVAITAAAMGAGYWALVAQQIAAALFGVAFLWTAVSWRPAKPSRGTGVRPLLRFGAGVSVANILYYFSSNADNILVGRFLGAAPLGLYARAYNLFLVPIRQIHAPIGNVVQPVMAAILGEPARYRQFYRRTLGSICLVGMPGVAFLAVMSREIIAVLLGTRWLGAAEPFRWLAIAGLLQMISRTFAWLFTTSGRAKAMASWAAVSAPVTVAAFVVGLHWGITGVAASYAIIQSVLIVPGIWWAVRDTPVGLRDVAAAVWRPCVLAAAVAAVSTGARLAVPGIGPAAAVAVSGVLAVACWLALVLRWPALRAEAAATLGTVRKRRAGSAD